ncbi:hypothetical protein [uncultured Mitsuokella sp.]|uniref:hypothetical protein n=1 Tax=uncultured Mitsuokella sp. TaxID=453120 RepID=UPI00259320EB|nr:hypothetical protein [uncultured Mitsuokella sp.]
MVAALDAALVHAVDAEEELVHLEVAGAEADKRADHDLVEENLPPIDSLAYIEVRFPWNRMFESDIIHTADEPVDISYFPKK